MLPRNPPIPKLLMSNKIHIARESRMKISFFKNVFCCAVFFLVCFLAAFFAGVRLAAFLLLFDFAAMNSPPLTLNIHILL